MPLAGFMSRRGFQTFFLLAWIVYTVYLQTQVGIWSRAEGNHAAAAQSAPDEELDERNGWELGPSVYRMQLQGPIYAVRVLKSILHHSNNTWRGKEGEAQGYMVQSMVWMQIVSPVPHSVNPLKLPL